MSEINSDYISGVVYTELNEELGPNPISWIPKNLDPRTTMNVAIKSITLLTAENGEVPKTLTILPFPSLKFKGIIKYLLWKDENRRGGIGTASICLLIHEADDLIFYKYIKEIESTFSDIADKLILMEETKRNEEVIHSELRNLIQKIESQLDQFKIAEEISFVSPIEDPSMFASKPELFQFKIAVCGDPSVGKTSLILRYTNKVFNSNYLPTLGVSVSSKIMQIDNSLVQLVIWDIAGQAMFKTMRAAFYKGARGVFFVYDLTNSESFNHLESWYNDVATNIPEFPKGYIIGNKNDLVEGRLINNVDAIQIAEKFNLEYIETSALTGERVELIFEKLARKLLFESR